MGLKRFLCEKLPPPGRSTKLSDAETSHALKVLRLKAGDCVQVLDGQGKSGIGILKTRSDGVWIEITNHEEGPHAQSRGVYPISLEAAVLKGDAMEWMIEKATELGVTHFIPLATDHTVVDTKKKGSAHFQGRWQKISDQALKQCGRLDRMQIHEVIELESLLTKYRSTPENPRFWCLENAPSQNLGDALKANSAIVMAKILVGPEGGFSEEEKSLLKRSASCDTVSLGPLVTRAETAALFAISLLRAHFMRP